MKHSKLKAELREVIPALVSVDYKTAYPEIVLTPEEHNLALEEVRGRKAAALNFPEVTLTDEETVYALFDARRAKAAIIAQNLYWARVRKQAEPLVLSNEQLQKFAIATAKKMGIDFQKDKWNAEIFEQLTLYFNNDEKFETSGYSLKKGIMLYGNVGCGKTTLLKMFTINPKCSYVYTSCNNVAKAFSAGGYEDISKYFHPFVLESDVFAQRNRGICFDDLGTEKSKKYFGNESNVMEEIILGWYDAFARSKERLHLSTNLTVPEIEKEYGSRVRSRMREMFNVFEFAPGAPDRRK